MNEELAIFARDHIKHYLSMLPEGSQTKFKRMYSQDITLDIETVVDEMPDEKLNRALSQVMFTFKGLDTGGVSKKSEDYTPTCGTCIYGIEDKEGFICGRTGSLNRDKTKRPDSCIEYPSGDQKP